MNKRNIVVVGGGTAGWLSALFAKKRYPNDNVIVIESVKMGIIGAGEGTVPMVLDLFENIDISLKELISSTKSTIKNGIKFVNWSNSGDYYYHGFSLSGAKKSIPGLNPNNFKIKSFPYIKLFSYSKDVKDTEHCFSTMMSENNLVPFTNENGIFENYSSHAVHFDARELAKFLKEKALERDIIYIDSKVINSDLDLNTIKTIYLENNEILNTDFIIDATGFSRYFIEKTLNEKWISYSKSLPANSAQAFFLKMSDPENIKPYTESTATDFGWIWNIPLQHRYGCGYVYDSRLVSNESVRKEIIDKYGEVEFIKEFHFDPGHFEKVWVGNCVAVGLSAGFVEPLEATSLQQTASTLDRIFAKNVDVFNPGGFVDLINKKTYDDSDSIRDFIYLHYITDKTNTDFWKNFTKNNEMPPSLSLILNSINEFKPLDVNDNLWSDFSYYVVAQGNGILDKNKLIDFYNKNIENNLNDINYNLNLKKDFAKEMIGHYEFLKLNGGFNE